MMSPAVRKEYETLRAMYPNYPAGLTLRAAKHEVALQVAEECGRIRFKIEDDDEPMSPDEWGWPEHEARKYRDDIASGRIQVFGVIAEVPTSCPQCGHGLGDWDTAASVWNVDVYDNAAGRAYLRETQRNLAVEAGVLA